MEPMECIPDLDTTVVMRGGDTIQALLGEFGPIIVTVYHLTYTQVIVTLGES